MHLHNSLIIYKKITLKFKLPGIAEPIYNLKRQKNRLVIFSDISGSKQKNKLHTCFMGLSQIKNRKHFLLTYFTFIFAKNSEMEETQTEREENQPVGKYWIMFIIAAIVQIIFLIWIREYFWMILPWWLTAFSKAMRL